MTGSRKKVVIAVIVIGAVVAAGIIGFFQLRDMAMTGVTEVPDTIALRKTNLESKVTASGNFSSLDPVSVGSNMLGGEVEYVMVEEGDRVYAGDVLARLKTSDIERNIADMRSAISDLSRGDRQKLEAAQRAVDDAQAQYDSDNYWTQRDINDAQTALSNAQKALSDANTAMADYLAVNTPAGTVDPAEVATLQKAIDAAQAAADGAQGALDQAKRMRESTLRAGSSRITEAQAQLDALRGVDSARQSRSQLDALSEELENSSVLSPITGVITRVLTEVGQSAMGTMFLIEDTESLQITAQVAEFDIIKIAEGMEAHVRSNATGSTDYSGMVFFVAPVASDLNGNFEVHILLTSGVGQLKPGMTATVEIVTAARQDIFAVPIDAVLTKPDGSRAIFAFENDTQREIPVQTGMETDFYIEIISDELREGMLIVSDPMGRNVRVMSGGPMVIGGPAGGQAVGGGPIRSEGTVTYVAD